MSSFEEAFELTGHGTFNYLALFTNGIILLYVTVECLGLGYVLPRAVCDLSLDTNERAFLGAATFIGVVTPAILWGYLADTYGRRRVMLPATVAAVLCSIMSSLSINFWSFVILRVITGVMVSASCATAYVYLGELTSPSRRTAAIAWGSLFITGSYMVMPGFAWILLLHNYSVHVVGPLKIVSWRVLMWAYTLLGSAACVGMYILPESPSYLLTTKGGQASLEVLAKIYSWNKKAKPDEYPITELIVPPMSRLTLKDSLAHMKFLLKPPLRRCILITHGCNFMVFMHNAFYVWLPFVVDELLRYIPTNPNYGLCRTMNEHYQHEGVRLPPVPPLVVKECENRMDSRVFPIALVMCIPVATVYMAIRFGVKKCGKPTIYSIIVIMCPASILLAAFIPSNSTAIAFYVIGTCGIAANTVLAAAVVDVIPTSLRALVMCTLFMVGRLGAAVGTNIVAWGFVHNCGTILLFINVLVAGSASLWCFWPDAAKTRAEMEAQDFSY